MTDLRKKRIVQILAMELLIASCASSNAAVENRQLPNVSRLEYEQVVEYPSEQPNQCLQLPERIVRFGEVYHSNISEWIGVDDWHFITNTNYLSVDIDNSGKPYLRQKLEPNWKGSIHVVGRGAIKPARTYRLHQSFFLEPGFDWGGRNEGGKLGFGLGGGTTPTGGNTDQDGFSARLMWRGNGDGNARLAVYAYSSDRSQNLPYGDDHFVQDFLIPVGQWFTVTMEVSANSDTGSSDGRVRVWIDDQLKLQRENIHWQAAGEQPVVDRLLFATFHGGNDSSWSPAHSVYAQFSSVCWHPSAYSPDPVKDDRP